MPQLCVVLFAVLPSLFCAQRARAAESTALPDNPMPITPRNSPVSVEHEGEDALGARLSTRLKELLNGSSLFQLQEQDIPKFRILISSTSEFKDRPSVGSAYSVIWVFSLKENTLRHYLAREVGVLTPDQVDDVAAKLVERTDTLAVRYSYLFPKTRPEAAKQTDETRNGAENSGTQEK